MPSLDVPNFLFLYKTCMKFLEFEVKWKGFFFIAYFYVLTILMTISKLNRIVRFLLEIKIFLKENFYSP